MSALARPSPHPARAGALPAAWPGGLPGRLDEVAAAYPDRVALSGPGSRARTYQELEVEANALANLLLGRGLRRGSVVAVLPEGRAEAVPAVLGVLRAGCAFAPLDPAFPDPLLAAMLAEVSPAAYVCSGRLVPRVAAAAPRTGTVVPVVPFDRPVEALPERDDLTLADEWWRRREEARPEVSAPGPDELAYVCFTSGSTGRPKPVAGRLKGVEHFVRWEGELVGAELGLRVSQLTSPAFDAWLRDVFLPLAHGGTVCIPPRAGGEVDARRLVGWLDAAGVEVLHCVPSLLRALLEEPLHPDLFPRLRWLFVAGERLLPEDVRRWLGVFGERIQLVNLYGATETTMTKLFHRVTSADATRASIPVGRPMPGARALVVDEEGRPCPPGALGEVWVRTPYRSLGYLGRPEETRNVFIPNPFSDDPEDLVYRSGDYGRMLPDGELELVGRRDQMVKVRGARVDLGEVENALRSHGGVRDLAVAERRDAGGNSYLAAYLVGERVSADDLRRHCAERLAPWMVPSAFAWLEAIPRTPNGKVDRSALPDPARTGGDGGRPPRGAVEETLAEIWCHLLGRSSVLAGDDFFQLGGHSLLAANLQSRIRVTFEVEIAAAELFTHTTLAGLAAVVAARRCTGGGVDEPALAPAPPGARPRLSLAEERQWILWRLAPLSPAYTMARSLRIAGELDTGALEGSFTEVVRRHEILRTRYRERSGEPVPEVLPAAPTRLPLVDLTGLPRTVRERAMRGIERSEAARPFDLERDPPMRVLLVRLDPRDHVVTVALHHIAADAASLHLLGRELGTLYEALAAGEPPALAAPELQYRDVAYRERHLLATERLDRALAFWRRELAGAPVALGLPTDLPRPPVSTFLGAAVPFAPPPDLGERLQRIMRREGATLFMVLLAAFAVVLHRRSGQREVVLGTSVANRHHPETERMVGLFANQVPLRIDFEGTPTLREVLIRARRTLLSTLDVQWVPFQLVVDAVRPPRLPNRNPIFQVMLELDQLGIDTGAAAESRLTLTPVPGERSRARMDLTLFVVERDGRLGGKLEYSTDLFEERTALGMSEELATVLERMATEPDRRVDEASLATWSPAKEETMKPKTDQRSSLDRFRTTRPRPVSLPEGDALDLVETGELEPGRELPLVIRPAAHDVDIAAWARDHLDRIDGQLARHGAILFRGFGVDTVDAFQELASCLCGELFHDNGEHDRESVAGDVATPTFYPPEKKLLWHNENSFNHRWPGRILFCCQRPASEGGETPLVDSRAVFEQLDASVRGKFQELGVSYVRNYGTGFGLDWRDVFRTDSRSEVERMCRDNRMEAEWREGDRLRTRCTRPAAIRHPETGAWSWFNQAQHFHPACLDPEVRESLAALFGGGDDMPRNCYFGDGSEIPDEVMAGILDLYRRLEVSFPWQRGDVLVVDNVLTAHARNPFQGERRLLIAMGRMHLYDGRGGAPDTRGAEA